MRSDETWDGCPQFGTVPEMLARDEWILLRLDQYGAPSVQIMVSFLALRAISNVRMTSQNIFVGRKKKVKTR